MNETMTVVDTHTTDSDFFMSLIGQGVVDLPDAHERAISTDKDKSKGK